MFLKGLMKLCLSENPKKRPTVKAILSAICSAYLEYFCKENTKVSFDKITEVMNRPEFDINDQLNEDQKSPLWIALDNNRLDVADELVKRGSNLELKNKDRTPMLVYFCQQKNTSIMNYLLQNKVSPDSTDKT